MTVWILAPLVTSICGGTAAISQPCHTAIANGTSCFSEAAVNYNLCADSCEQQCVAETVEIIECYDECGEQYSRQYAECYYCQDGGWGEDPQGNPNAPPGCVINANELCPAMCQSCEQRGGTGGMPHV